MDHDDDVTDDYATMKKKKDGILPKTSRYAAAAAAYEYTGTKTDRKESKPSSDSRSRRHSSRSSSFYRRSSSRSIHSVHSGKMREKTDKEKEKEKAKAKDKDKDKDIKTAASTFLKQSRRKKRSVPSASVPVPSVFPLQSTITATTAGTSHNALQALLSRSFPVPLVPVTPIVQSGSCEMVQRSNSLPAIVGALQFEFSSLEDFACEEISPFILKRFISFHHHEEIKNDKLWMLLLDELHIPEEKRKTPYDEKKHEANRAIKNIIREDPSVMDLLLKTRTSIIAILDRLTTIWLTLISFGRVHTAEHPDPYAYAEDTKRKRTRDQELASTDDEDEDDEEDGNGEREHEKEKEKEDEFLIDEPLYVELPCFVQFQQFCTALDEEVAGRLRNWMYTVRSSQREELDLVIVKQFIRESIRHILVKHIPMDIGSPLKMLEKAAAQHQEHLQQFGSIVGTFLNHREPILRACYVRYEQHKKAVMARKSRQRFEIKYRLAVSEENRLLRTTLRSSLDRMHDTLTELTQANVAIHKHNEKVQNVLMSLLEKLQKPTSSSSSITSKKTDIDKEKDKDKDKDKPNYRALLATTGAKDEKEKEKK